MTASGIGIQVDGLNALTRDLLALGLDVDDLKGAFGPIAAQGAILAANFAPHRSGKLARSIRGNRAKNKAVVTAGKKAVPYAGAINYGWGTQATNYKHGRYVSGMHGSFAGTHFMQQADEAIRPVALRQLDREIDKAIRRRGLG